MLWVLWNNINNWIWKNEKSDVNQLGVQVFHSWKDWFIAQKNQHSADNEHQNQQQSIWQPPHVGWVKCNVEARFNNQRGTTNKG